MLYYKKFEVDNRDSLKIEQDTRVIRGHTIAVQSLVGLHVDVGLRMYGHVYKSTICVIQFMIPT